MGCSSCSTATSTGTPAGCRSNGTCGTGGCNKLNVYNWLSDMYLPEGQKSFDIVEIRFKGSRKEFYRNINNLEVHVGEMVAVEGNPGHDIGEVSMVGELVRFQLRKRGLKEDSHEIKQLYRTAKQADVDKWKEVKDLEFTTMHSSRKMALALNLKMKISDVEYQGDGKKATFFYTADDRVDFRELIKRLADQFKVRIEMRQIGMRQEAARLGGIGSCGRELCCSTWLTDFKVVSTSAARYQNLSLNPIKLAGQCGKLKCCLNYELDTYMDAVRDIPDSGIKLLTGKGTLLHRKTDIFKRIMWYALLPEPREGDERTFFGAEQWVPMDVDRVKEIIALNKQGVKPDDTGAIELEEEEDELGYDDVVGQDSLTRMDRKKKKKKKKKPGATSSAIPSEAGARPQQPQQKNPQGQGQQRPQQKPAGGAPQRGANPRQQPQQGDASQKPQQQKPQQEQRNTSPGQQPPQNKPQQEQRNAPPRRQPPTGNQPPAQTSAQPAPQQKPQTTPQQNPQPAPQAPKPAPVSPAQSPQQQGARPQRQAPAENGKVAGNPATPPANPTPAPSGNRPPRKAPGSDNA
jgi:cell fate regulator YaaT (PSP1 superfamily)